MLTYKIFLSDLWVSASELFKKYVILTFYDNCGTGIYFLNKIQLR